MRIIAFGYMSSTSIPGSATPPAMGLSVYIDGVLVQSGSAGGAVSSYGTDFVTSWPPITLVATDLVNGGAGGRSVTVTVTSSFSGGAVPDSTRTITAQGLLR
jgi:hypothetical protein